MLKVLFSAKPAAWDEYETPLTRAFQAAGLQVDLARDHAPSDVDYIVFAPNGQIDYPPAGTSIHIAIAQADRGQIADRSAGKPVIDLLLVNRLTGKTKSIMP